MRYRLARTWGSRWGPGRVHVTFYDGQNKEWRLVCRPDAWWHLKRLEVEADVTCRNCQRLVA